MMTAEDSRIQIGIMAVAVNGAFGFGGEAETGVGRGEESDFSSEDMVFQRKVSGNGD